MRTSPKLFLLLFCILFSIHSFADMPGNPVRQDVSVKIIGVKTLQPYTIFIQDEYKDSLIKILTDTSYTISASQGAPHGIMIFGSSKSSNTDTIFFDEYGQENGIITFTGIANNKLLSTIEKTSIILKDTTNTETIKNKVVVELSHTSTSTWLIGISVSALVALIIFFVIKNKKAVAASSKETTA